MKKLLLLPIFTLVYLASTAQCADLFFSEYVEGSFNNKAIEIYNPTSSTVDLSDYRLGRYRNGAASVDSFAYLSGFIQPYDVYVIVIDKRDPAGTGNETPVDLALQAKADIFLNPEYDNGIHPMYFNGDDGLVLEKISNGQVVDLIGKIGEQPNNAWSSNFPHNGPGDWYTRNQTLIRKSSIQDGDLTSPTVYDPTIRWDTAGYDFFDSLGSHTCDCYVPPVNCTSYGFNNSNPICGVGYMESTGKNAIVWENDAALPSMTAYNVYRLNPSTTNYDIIGFVTSSGNTWFEDPGLNPEFQFGSYKISLVDTCGVESALSPAHTSLLLSATIDGNGDVSLTWNAYSGLTIDSISILRSDMSGGALQEIAKVPSTFVSYQDNVGLTANDTSTYQLQIDLPSSCNTTGPISPLVNIQSNKKQMYAGVSSSIAIREYENDLKVFPNPATNQLNIALEVAGHSSQLMVFDALGRNVLSSLIDADVSSLDISTLENGMYQLLIIGEKNYRASFIKQ